MVELVKFPYGAVVRLYEFPKETLADGVGDPYEAEGASGEYGMSTPSRLTWPK